MVARNMLSNYKKRNKEYRKWHLVGFSYPHWITMHGQPHIRFLNMSAGALLRRGNTWGFPGGMKNLQGRHCSGWQGGFIDMSHPSGFLHGLHFARKNCSVTAGMLLCRTIRHYFCSNSLNHTVHILGTGLGKLQTKSCVYRTQIIVLDL